MKKQQLPQHSALRRFFEGLTEHVFHVELGVADAPLIEYVACLLERFIRCETVYRIRNLSGHPIGDVVGMLHEGNMRIGNARRVVHVHIGDYTMFWCGLYPESLRTLQAPENRDHYVDYCTQGKRAYKIAADIATDQHDATSSELLYQLSEEFNMCAYGLREIRREWECHGEEDETLHRTLILT